MRADSVLPIEAPRPRSFSQGLAFCPAAVLEMRLEDICVGKHSSGGRFPGRAAHLCLE